MKLLRQCLEGKLTCVVCKKQGGEGAQPTCWKVKTRVKFVWSGNDGGTAGVGFLLAEKWVKNVWA